LGIIVFGGWLSAWFFLSGANERFAAWAYQSFIGQSAEAGMTVQNILIEGREYTDADLLRALINMQEGDPLLDFHPNEVQPLIEKISWIEKADVARRLPDTIYVRLHERKPFALWQHEGKVVVIDHTGHILTEEMRPIFKELFLVTGDDANEHAKEIIELLRTEPIILSESEAAMRVGERRWDLKLKNGMLVHLPEKDLGYAFRRLADEQSENDIFSRNISTIDLREPDRLIVQTNVN